MDKTTDIEQAIKRLEGLDTPALKAEWRRVFGREPSRLTGAEFMRGNLIYTVQADAYGDLPDTTKAYLRQLYKTFKENPDYRPDRKKNALRPGIKLIREWHGKVYEVEVLKDGYQFEGQKYTGLSTITKVITGTRWSGRKFFGLNAVGE